MSIISKLVIVLTAYHGSFIIFEYAKNFIKKYFSNKEIIPELYLKIVKISKNHIFDNWLS